MSKINYIKKDLSKQIENSKEIALILDNINEKIFSKHKLKNLDYKIEIKYFESFKSHWISLLFFENSKPESTGTVLKLRLFDDLFPVYIDLNYLDIEDVDLSKINIIPDNEDYIDLDDMSFASYDESELNLILEYFIEKTLTLYFKKYL